MTRNWMRAFLSGVAISAATVTLSVSASADTLFGAMEKAYVTNPTLNAARAGQRATDELVPQALSGWRPTVGVSAEINRTYSSQPVGVDLNGDIVRDNGDATNSSVAIQLAQPLFRGFGTVNSTKAAEARVDAGKQNLLQTEQQVLFDVVQAYMDVYAGRQFVVLRQQDVAALQAQVKAARDRFAVGEITRTDVAQAQARLAEAQSFLVNSQTDLARAVATYLQVVGQEPDKLNYPKVVNVPNSLKTALDTAGQINPQVLAQAFVESARNSDIKVAFSSLLPSADLVASAARVDPDLSTPNQHTRQAVVGAQLSIPLYESGIVYSQVRQAKQLASQSRIQVIEVARAVRQAVASSWNAYVGLAQIIKNTRTQVSAAQLALQGVQAEYQAGTRTTLDVLDAQRDLVQAQVLQVTAERNRVVSGYQLLAAIGHLTAKEVGLKVPVYDPDANYKRVRNKWIGTDVKTVE
ncbi:TolC family outer membrane protein [Aestuariivirga sp.]|uniref:TolC family outer membrane protein n=1 Tax=Aestuariivirga sp. TaxID=2650926 RepID=UPI0025C55199|nr:TolC family outer membrane protein [Aestuariivirga sp.]MCA3555488.1 TolC family outer membrane protein [Aestuariivirga sp.]